MTFVEKEIWNTLDEETRVYYVLAVTNLLLNRRKKPPTSENPVTLENNICELGLYLWTALMVFGQSKNMNFNHKAIEVKDFGWGPDRKRYDFKATDGKRYSCKTETGTIFRFSSGSLYERVFKPILARRDVPLSFDANEKEKEFAHQVPAGQEELKRQVQLLMCQDFLSEHMELKGDIYSFKNTTLGAYGSIKIIQAFKLIGLKEAKVLDWANFPFQDFSPAEISTIIASSPPNIEVFLLRGFDKKNRWESSARSAEVLAMIVRSCPIGIKSLDLSKNELYRWGFAGIVAGIPAQVESINLSGNGFYELRNEQLAHVVNSLGETFTCVDLTGNRLTRQHIEYLQNANPKLLIKDDKVFFKDKLAAQVISVDLPLPPIDSPLPSQATSFDLTLPPSAISSVIEEELPILSEDKISSVIPPRPISPPILDSSPLPQPEPPLIELAIHHEDIALGAKIGQGGFGTVYQATWQETPVAVKELHFHDKLGEVLLTDFQKEAKMMRDLRHHRVISLFGATFTPPYWLVLELMSRGSLYTLLHSLEGIDWPLRLQWAQQIVEGLVYLHGKNIVHQDLKSMNILLDGNNQTKIADFGLAKIKTQSQSSSLHHNPTGTLAWIAPEILTQEAGASAATDMYSYGMILWEIVAREIPYKNANGNPGLIAGWVVQRKFPPIPNEVPAVLCQLIEGCRSAPETRPTASTVFDQLDMWVNPTPPPVLSSSPNEEIKNESSIQENYQGGLASGSFFVASVRPQNSQLSPSALGSLHDYQGAMFSNRGATSRASTRGQPKSSPSRGRPSAGQAPSQRGAKPSNQGSCRNQ